MSLTWEEVLRYLTRKYGDDVAQEVVCSFLRAHGNLSLIRGLRYFNRAGHRAKIVLHHRRRFDYVELRQDDRKVKACQLTRVLAREAWDRAPQVVKDDAWERAGHHGHTHRSNTDKVRCHRARRRLVDGLR